MKSPAPWNPQTANRETEYGILRRILGDEYVDNHTLYECYMRCVEHHTYALVWYACLSLFLVFMDTFRRGCSQRIEFRHGMIKDGNTAAAQVLMDVVHKLVRDDRELIPVEVHTLRRDGQGRFLDQVQIKYDRGNEGRFLKKWDPNRGGFSMYLSARVQLALSEQAVFQIHTHDMSSLDETVGFEGEGTLMDTIVALIHCGKVDDDMDCSDVGQIAELLEKCEEEALQWPSYKRRMEKLNAIQRMREHFEINTPTRFYDEFFDPRSLFESSDPQPTLFSLLTVPPASPPRRYHNSPSPVVETPPRNLELQFADGEGAK